MSFSWNTSFRRPTAHPQHRQRTPPPPRAYVEPLSPQPRPRPVEPNFNYPALTHVDYRVRAEPARPATSSSRAPVASYRHGHHRTPSIDTLAEAALAVSPGFVAYPRPSSGPQQYQNRNYEPNHYASYGTSEPPHKRSRSELLPSPQVGAYGSRPATSYEAHAIQQGAYDSRVEEAALLLNFRTGGWPVNGGAMSPPQVPASAAAHRPHANSFPRDGRYTRPADGVQQAPLLPPFSPALPQQERVAPPTQHQTLYKSTSAPYGPHRTTKDEDTAMINTDRAPYEQRKGSVYAFSRQQQTPMDDTVSNPESPEIAPSEASDASKTRRGWPKGKPRGTGSRKTIAEKVATKRAIAARKNNPNSKRMAKKAPGPAAIDHDVTLAKVPRRKSASDMTVDAHGTATACARSTSVPRDNDMLVRDPSPTKPTKRQAKIAPETICQGCLTSRESALANSEMDEWISCNGCKKWFHIDCAGFKKALEVKDVDKYFCTACEPKHGKTTFVRKSARAHASVDYAELQRGVLKTSEESNEHHYIQPIKDGTFQFDPEMFPRLKPEMVTREFFEKSGIFVEPICIPAAWNPRPWKEKAQQQEGFSTGHQPSQKEDAIHDGMFPDDFEYDTVEDVGQDKLGMVMPEGLTVRQVCNMVGGDTPLDVIDVKTQNSGQKWNLNRWADYYEQEGDDKPIRNVISLEVSHTRLGRLLRRPQIVRDIDLQDSVWPREERDKGKWPKVQYYCLMSVADSYTDFHVDFGGSSVYYHILKGKKTFFFIPPKPKHLKAYEEWNESPQQNFTFLPSITKECYRVDLSEGDTMLIPSGWIHAVWTPETSLVIGGNFLTRMSFKNQFKLVEIEKANHTPMKFRYPFFQRIMWYTALQYLAEDPLPPEVSEQLNAGRRFERRIPIWQDFDGNLSANDDRVGARNARYYSQAELEGLPELMNYIWRTVMSVLGRVDGVSEDQKKRINASIPKGYGEPLEIAKNFALWVSWKCGNADPPAWIAHPDFSFMKDEVRPKKLSARALKDLERKEAIAAWRIAPDRQSARMMSKHSDAAPTTAVAAVATHEIYDGATTSQSPAPLHEGTPDSSSDHQYSSHQPVQYTPSAAPPSLLMMSPMAGQHFSTPKTSVLGPKRVACDTCRKRRIKCKHKDSVMTATPELMGQFPGMGNMGPFTSNGTHDMHDSITLSGATNGQYQIDGQYDEQMTGYSGNGVNGFGHGQPTPGTNAYIQAHIPMLMNGSPMFGEAQKRGRTKACFECRKSKRRCVHDESGKVDPVKAAETPVPRGNVKKRSSEDGGSPASVKKLKQDEESQPPQPPPPAQGGTAGVLTPARAPAKTSPARQRSTQTPPQIVHHPPDDEPAAPELDPNLFSAYPDPGDQNQYANHNYPYPIASEQQSNGAYEYPSLEQIASEVLDMNGQADEDYIDRQLNALPFQRLQGPRGTDYYRGNGGAYVPNGVGPKPDESVDSAISMPSSEILQQNGMPTMDNRERSVDERLMEAFATSGRSFGNQAPKLNAIPTIEVNGMADGEHHQASTPHEQLDGVKRPYRVISDSPMRGVEAMLG
ncbi:JmjC domain-containing histone demethylation protein 1 [Recurvomyces mirabilis]|uniref:JmjC domain-containing histone demethylation protein 1 n=1 Tax=Recurvomyces mirabilis TaxID=574656 RepID=A0AAE0TM11_9PEZI|nr:JmjC domain-containing histone demethylation protein 1 [Recurvomyces mirabilis]KAK5152536.1 JmjC domain-containing histone demethylation protein 1 [Recurvomyces mirabilis]